MKKNVNQKTTIGKDGEIITVRETVKEKKYTQAQYEKAHKQKTFADVVFSKTTVVVVLVIIVLAIIALYVFQVLQNSEFNSKPRAEVVKGTMYDIVDGDSVLVSSLSENIKSKVSSTVTKVHYVQGQTVRSGAKLLELDNTFAKNEISRYDTALTNMKNMLAFYEQKIENLSIKAPVDGFIVNVKVKQGDNVNPGDLLASFIPTTTFTTYFDCVYEENRKIEPWQKAVITYEGGSVNGIVYDITGTSEQGKTIQVGVYVTDSSVNLSGLKVSGEIETLNGKVKSISQSTIHIVQPIPVYASESGQVTSININNSRAIKAGTTLIALSNPDLLTKKSAYRNDVSTLQNTVNYKNNYDLNNYVIYAQVGGVIQTPELKVGDLVTANSEIILIETENEIKASMYVSSAYIDNIALGQNAKIYVDIDGKTVELSGKVTNKESRLLLQENVDYTVEVTVNSADSKPEYIGKPVVVGVVLNEKKDALYVPTDYVYGATVYVPQNGKAVPVTVSIGMQNSQYTEILSGLTEKTVIMQK